MPGGVEKQKWDSETWRGLTIIGAVIASIGIGIEYDWGLGLSVLGSTLVMLGVIFGLLVNQGGEESE